MFIKEGVNQEWGNISEGEEKTGRANEEQRGLNQWEEGKQNNNNNRRGKARVQDEKETVCVNNTSIFIRVTMNPEYIQ